MKSGIIGLPQVGKTSLFRILTKVNLSEPGHIRTPRERTSASRKCPDERLDKIGPRSTIQRKLTHASVEYWTSAPSVRTRWKETAYIGHLRLGGRAHSCSPGV